MVIITRRLFLATSGHLQVINYIQALWETIVNSSGSSVDSQLYNGGVEAIHTLLSERTRTLIWYRIS